MAKFKGFFLVFFGFLVYAFDGLSTSASVCVCECEQI